MTGDERKSPVP